MQAAEKECKGVLTRNGSTIHGWRLIDPRERISHRHASEELAAWLADNGQSLRYSEWLEQLREEQDRWQ